MFKLKILTDNAAFGETEAERCAEVARILREAANALDRFDAARNGGLRDANGNLVGTYDFTAGGE